MLLRIPDVIWGFSEFLAFCLESLVRGKFSSNNLPRLSINSSKHLLTSGVFVLFSLMANMALTPYAPTV